jgi:hypothetical protein
MGEERVDVFFYGLFMDEQVLAEQGIQATQPRRAYAEGLRLRIGQRATLVPEGGARAYGMVYALTKGLEALYAQPGLEAYRAEPIEVRVVDGSNLTAMLQPRCCRGSQRGVRRALRDVLTRLGFHRMDMNSPPIGRCSGVRSGEPGACNHSDPRCSTS